MSRRNGLLGIVYYPDNLKQAIEQQLQARNLYLSVYACTGWYFWRAVRPRLLTRAYLAPCLFLLRPSGECTGSAPALAQPLT